MTLRVTHHHGVVSIETGVTRHEVEKAVADMEAERGALHSGDNPWADPDRHERHVESLVERLVVRDVPGLIEDLTDAHRQARAWREDARIANALSARINSPRD